MPLSEDEFVEVLRRSGYTPAPVSEGYFITGGGVFGIVAWKAPKKNAIWT